MKYDMRSQKENMKIKPEQNNSQVSLIMQSL